MIPSDLKNGIERNIESLMKLSELQEDHKLTDIDEKKITFNIAPWTLLRDVLRIGQNYGTRTRNVLEKLYHEVESSTNQILQSVCLNVVLLPSKQQISYSENEIYQGLRDLLIQQTDWLEKSMSGLRWLDKAYEGKEKKYLMLCQNSQSIITNVRNKLLELENAHRKLAVLHVLALNSNLSSPLPDSPI